MAYTTSGDLAPRSGQSAALPIIDLVLTRRVPQPVEELEPLWRARESASRWNNSDEVCVRLLDWLHEGDSGDE